MSESESVKGVYEDYRQEVLTKLEAERGKEWVEANCEMLEKSWRAFESLNLL